jgi:hypothetical protein
MKSLQTIESKHLYLKLTPPKEKIKINTLKNWCVSLTTKTLNQNSDFPHTDHIDQNNIFMENLMVI